MVLSFVIFTLPYTQERLAKQLEEQQQAALAASKAAAAQQDRKQQVAEVRLRFVLMLPR